MMTLNEYQERAKSTAVYPDKTGLSYTILGLCGEAGEIANKYKKVLRDNDGVIDAPRRSAMLEELGDVLWYVAMIAQELNIKLDELAVMNVYKLQTRKEQNKIQGSGDNR